MYLQICTTLLEVHSNVGSHAAQGVAFVTTNRASEGFDALVGIHVTLSGTGCGTDSAANRAPPTAGRSAGAGMTATWFYYCL